MSQSSEIFYLRKFILYSRLYFLIKKTAAHSGIAARLVHQGRSITRRAQQDVMVGLEDPSPATSRRQPVRDAVLADLCCDRGTAWVGQAGPTTLKSGKSQFANAVATCMKLLPLPLGVFSGS